jgi:hypothetical protein
MARWLLMTHDRVLGYEFCLIQEFLALMMGARRASIVEAASPCRRGLIRYSRGQMAFANRAGFEARTCECYWVVTRGWDRLLGPDFLTTSSISR